MASAVSVLILMNHPEQIRKQYYESIRLKFSGGRYRLHYPRRRILGLFGPHTRLMTTESWHIWTKSRRRSLNSGERYRCWTDVF